MQELIKLDNSIKLDIRYAREDNFVGKPVYNEPRAFLQSVAATALIRVHKNIRNAGFGIVVFDGYRPWSVTKLFWEVVSEQQRKFVADPAEGSRHNRGCAVDLSMFYLQSGDLCEMPSDFDEFNERASPDFTGGTETETFNRDFLRRSMEAEGFSVNQNEWWHFDHKDWEKFAITDLSFSELDKMSLQQQ
ncbi:MAG: M15 family metallopeptidase [Pyrinomonadaceae bacterium]